MNRELRELFDEKNLVVRKLTLINDVRIVDTGDERVVIKQKEDDLDDLFKYLRSRSFDYFPPIIYSTDNYDVYKYIDDTKLEKEEKLLDIVRLVIDVFNVILGIAAIVLTVMVFVNTKGNMWAFPIILPGVQLNGKQL